MCHTKEISNANTTTSSPPQLFLYTSFFTLYFTGIPDGYEEDVPNRGTYAAMDSGRGYGRETRPTPPGMTQISISMFVHTRHNK